jgi:hypothetical protein
MSTGTERLAFGDAVQNRIAANLEARGLAVKPLGQALLAPDVREVLRQTNSLLRWLPDLVGWRPVRPRMFLIDAKGTMRRATTNHSIELRVLLAARFTMLPTFYICDEDGALAADQVWPPTPESPIHRYCCDGCMAKALDDPTGRLLPIRCPEHARKGGRGSGTPYALIPKTACVPLDALFGKVGQAAA